MSTNDFVAMMNRDGDALFNNYFGDVMQKADEALAKHAASKKTINATKQDVRLSDISTFDSIFGDIMSKTEQFK